MRLSCSCLKRTLRDTSSLAFFAAGPAIIEATLSEYVL
jgi:hypothetical protein